MPVDPGLPEPCHHLHQLEQIPFPARRADRLPGGQPALRGLRPGWPRPPPTATGSWVLSMRRPFSRESSSGPLMPGSISACMNSGATCWLTSCAHAGFRGRSPEGGTVSALRVSAQLFPIADDVAFAAACARYRVLLVPGSGFRLSRLCPALLRRQRGLHPRFSRGVPAIGREFTFLKAAAILMLATQTSPRRDAPAELVAAHQQSACFYFQVKLQMSGAVICWPCLTDYRFAVAQSGPRLLNRGLRDSLDGNRISSVVRFRPIMISANIRILQ